MKNKTLLTLTVVAALAPVLAACGLGYNKNPPNEFNVVRRAPLILPPDFELRPPSNSEAAPVIAIGAELARLVVLRTPSSERQPDAVEQRLLDKASKDGVYGNGVRDAMQNERSGKASIDADLVENLTRDQAEVSAE
jgi:hypothetical protein